MITLNRKKAIYLLSHKMATNWEMKELWKCFKNGIDAVDTYTNKKLLEELKCLDKTEEYEIVDWRDLEDGEILEEGDEYYNSMLGKWITIKSNEYFINSDIGQVIEEHDQPMRRKTTWK